ncbi:hypothetical protein GOODEAATRI_017766 [Goodea atripinnis]|uniref:Reelin n=1 Tax=Goodea atripinnis TaxID=208336 RepID=A0ABV0NVN3_9TELE
MQIGASYSLQFSLVMGCGREPSPHIDTQVRLEFSTNHGLTWHLVKEAGLRQLVSWDLDTEWAEFVQFYLRVGGDWAECNQADSREEGVLLQYSNDGGISWGLIAEMYFTDFIKPR